MEKYFEELIQRYEHLTPTEKLSLKDEQKKAVKELEAALVKCRDANVALVEMDGTFYAVDGEDIYDMDAFYNDYSVEDVDITKMETIDMRCLKVDGYKEKVPVSFYSTTFLCNGITH